MEPKFHYTEETSALADLVASPNCVPPPKVFAPPEHHRPFPSSMDASTPLKRSSTEAGLDSPKGSVPPEPSRPTPKISKARACELVLPTWPCQ